MIRKLLISLGYFGTHILCGVELSSESPVSRVLLVRNNKGRLDVLEQKKFEDHPSLLTYLAKSPGLPLVLKTQGLSVGKWLTEPIADPLREVMGVSIENKKDFVIQTFPGAEKGEVFAVVARKETHDRLFEALGLIQKRIVSHYFSNVIFSALIPFLSGYSPPKTYLLQTPSGDYWWRNGLVAAQDIQGEIVTTASCAEDLDMDEEWLPLYGAVVHSWIFPHSNPTFSKIRLHQQALKKTHRWIRVMVWISMVLAGLLLLNMAMRSVIYLKRKQTEAQIGAGSMLLNKMAENQRMIAALRERFGQYQQQNFSRVSILTDRIASVADSDIVFEEMIIFPSIKELRKIDEKLTGQPPDMLIRGQSKTSIAVSSMVEEMGRINEGVTAGLFFSEYDYVSGMYEFVVTGFVQSEKK
ncbi:MAG: hypothetical protein R3D00_23295 [Bacteroidia bacterium]